jgi:hypothetical protein
MKVSLKGVFWWRWVACCQEKRMSDQQKKLDRKMSGLVWSSVDGAVVGGVSCSCQWVTKDVWDVLLPAAQEKKTFCLPSLVEYGANIFGCAWVEL